MNTGLLTYVKPMQAFVKFANRGERMFRTNPLSDENLRFDSLVSQRRLDRNPYKALALLAVWNCFYLVPFRGLLASIASTATSSKN